MATVIKWQALIDFVGYWHRRNDDDGPERKDKNRNSSFSIQGTTLPNLVVLTSPLALIEN